MSLLISEEVKDFQDTYFSLHSRAIVTIWGPLEITSGNVLILRTKTRPTPLPISTLSEPTSPFGRELLIYIAAYQMPGGSNCMLL